MVSTRFALVAILLAVLSVAHRETFASMMHTWLTNTTYNHGFLIPLIAAFFAWQARHEARATAAEVYWTGLIALGGVSLLWVIASIVNVQVIAQFASVALASCIVLSIAGPRQAAVFALPLTYLLFLVPVGQGIVPQLMDWTANFTVSALQIVGIPVFRDGLFFSTTAGNFEVAEACSGVRYLLASVAAGVAFAFLTFTQWKKRALFVVAAFIVPVIANGLRAFGIVLIAHFSDMQMATGIDHFIYGWVFFGVIIFLLFMVGGRFADRKKLRAPRRANDTLQKQHGPGFSALVTAGSVVLAILLAGPALVEYRTNTSVRPQPALPASAPLTGNWLGPFSAEPAWQLGYKGADAMVSGSYTEGAHRIEVRVAAYGDQQQGAELINAQNRIAEGEDWRILDLGTILTGSKAVPRVRAVRLIAGSRRYLVWYWYQQGTQVTTSNYMAKWLEAMAILAPTPATVVAIAAEEPEDRARELLTVFSRSSGAMLRYCAAGLLDRDCLVPESVSARSR